MRNHVITITDNKGKQAMLRIHTPSTFMQVAAPQLGVIGLAISNKVVTQDGDWMAMEHGLIACTNGGTCSVWDSTVSAFNLFIGDATMNQASRITWGIKLFAYEDRLGVNDIGTGNLAQAWALSLEPGQIRWEISTYSQLVNYAVREQNAPPVERAVHQLGKRMGRGIGQK